MGFLFFASTSGDTLPRLEGCSSSLFQPVSRQAGSGGASASLRMAAGQNIAFPAPWGEEMAAGSRMQRWAVFDGQRPFCYWGGRSREVNLTPKLGPLAVTRDGENVMVSGREEPVRELAGKGSRGKRASAPWLGQREQRHLGDPSVVADGIQAGDLQRDTAA